MEIITITYPQGAATEPVADLAHGVADLAHTMWARVADLAHPAAYLAHMVADLAHANALMCRGFDRGKQFKARSKNPFLLTERHG